MGERFRYKSSSKRFKGGCELVEPLFLFLEKEVDGQKKTGNTILIICEASECNI
ncbi:hypothetical protein BC781_102234 [Sediminitomix flava]|uniref:Uncharacterized protein n=1 Tax=Sediminitomix flava TaxID=379075 RepID=A0A315ZC45_SEDFL|nr:hypothetical protein BC781_102234 [Sediminitomix flava]